MRTPAPHPPSHALPSPNDASLAPSSPTDSSSCPPLPSFSGSSPGDLIASYLDRCNALQRVNLNNTNAAGDVGVLFRGKQSLEEVSAVGCGTLEGNAAATFGAFPFLRSLDLRKCSGVTGQLAALGGPGAHLHVLYLEGSGVEGRVDDLAPHCPNLRRLRLAGMETKAAGTLGSLGRHCVRLEELHLSETAVTGSLEDLSGLTCLESLCLEDLHDGLTGDLRGLEPLLRLRELRLSRSRVAGDLASLAHLACLTELRLHGTYIHGEPLDALGALRRLTVVSLSADDFADKLDLATDGSSPRKALSMVLPDTNFLLL